MKEYELEAKVYAYLKARDFEAAANKLETALKRGTKGTIIHLQIKDIYHAD